jgi:hypothetical protein
VWGEATICTVMSWPYRQLRASMAIPAAAGIQKTGMTEIRQGRQGRVPAPHVPYDSFLIVEET